jgi:transposase
MSSKTQSRRKINPDVVVVGIDVAKRRHVAVCRDGHGNKHRPFAFPNDRIGFEKLVEQARSTQHRVGCSEVVFALEATGHYGHALRQYLADAGFGLLAINPAHTKRAKELEDNSPEKSDRKDAGLIADLAAEGRGRTMTIPRGAFAELRRLGKQHERLVVERTRQLNRYHGLVDLLFPELTFVVRDVACRSLLKLMAEYPTALDLAQLDYEELESRLRRWSRGQINREQIGRIHQLSRESVGLREGLSAARLEMRQTLQALKTVEEALREVEREQAGTLRRVPYADLLKTVPGLGETTLAIILGETGDLRQYPHGDAVIKLAGYNLYRIASGCSKGRVRITKRGRPLLRRQLYLAAMRLAKEGEPLGGYRERLKPRVVGPKIMVGGCRKLIRLMVALVRDGRPYEPGRLGVQSL